MKEKSEIAKEELEGWIESARNAHQMKQGKWGQELFALSMTPNMFI